MKKIGRPKGSKNKSIKNTKNYNHKQALKDFYYQEAIRREQEANGKFRLLTGNIFLYDILVYEIDRGNMGIELWKYKQCDCHHKERIKIGTEHRSKEIFSNIT